MLSLLLIIVSGVANAQASKSSKSSNWVKVKDDAALTVYYDSNIKTDSQGRHTTWVKAIFHTSDWQNYFSQLIGSRTPVAYTKTKAMFSNDYTYVMSRQVICYSKANKVLYNTGDGTEGGWGVVNASDPLGIVGEYLMEKYNCGYGYY